MARAQRDAEKARRRAAQALVVAYHEAELAKLINHVAEAIDRYRAGELDANEVDDVIFRYSKAARELWKFCFASGPGHMVTVAAALEGFPAEDRPDWWAEAERRR